MTSQKMRLYLILERELIALDDAQDPFADQLRDLMDPLWRALSDEEQVQLDARGTIIPATPGCVVIPVKPPLREQLAAYTHHLWCSWIQCLFELSTKVTGENGEVSFVVPPKLVEQWADLSFEDYQDLPEHDKERERRKADKILAILTRGA